MRPIYGGSRSSNSSITRPPLPNLDYKALQNMNKNQEPLSGPAPETGIDPRLTREENKSEEVYYTDAMATDARTQRSVEGFRAIQAPGRIPINEKDIGRYQGKTAILLRRAESTNERRVLPRTEDSAAAFDSLFGKEYTQESTGARTIRQSGGKDRHSKVFTSKGPRDRRVRLSVSTAIQFYDVQDRLGFDQPSQAVEWLIKKAKSAIDELAHLPDISLQRYKMAECNTRYSSKIKDTMPGPSSAAYRGHCKEAYSRYQDLPTNLEVITLATKKNSYLDAQVDCTETSFTASNRQSDKQMIEGQSIPVDDSEAGPYFEQLGMQCWNPLESNGGYISPLHALVQVTARGQILETVKANSSDPKEHANIQVGNNRSSPSANMPHNNHDSSFYGAFCTRNGDLRTTASQEIQMFNSCSSSLESTLIQIFRETRSGICVPKNEKVDQSKSWLPDEFLDQLPLAGAVAVESSPLNSPVAGHNVQQLHTNHSPVCHSISSHATGMQPANIGSAGATLRSPFDAECPTVGDQSTVPLQIMGALNAGLCYSESPLFLQRLARPDFIKLTPSTDQSHLATRNYTLPTPQVHGSISGIKHPGSLIDNNNHVSEVPTQACTFMMTANSIPNYSVYSSVSETGMPSDGPFSSDEVKQLYKWTTIPSERSTYDNLMSPRSRIPARIQGFDDFEAET